MFPFSPSHLPQMKRKLYRESFRAIFVDVPHSKSAMRSNRHWNVSGLSCSIGASESVKGVGQLFFMLAIFFREFSNWPCLTLPCAQPAPTSHEGPILAALRAMPPPGFLLDLKLGGGGSRQARCMTLPDRPLLHHAAHMAAASTLPCGAAITPQIGCATRSQQFFMCSSHHFLGEDMKNCCHP